MYKNNLFQARNNIKKTQAEIAKALNMNINVYGRYERGDRDIPLSIAIQMADVLNITLDYLAARSGGDYGVTAADVNSYVEENIIAPLSGGKVSKESLKKIADNLRKSIDEASGALQIIEKQAENMED